MTAAAPHPTAAGRGPGGDPPADGPGEDVVQRLARLAKLRDAGALTEEEFQRARATLLAQWPATTRTDGADDS